MKVSASEPAAERAAATLIDQGARAVDAVIGGFLGAAGSEPGVLLGSAVALVAGVGAGARCFDGRALQPGRDAARPRGLPPGQPVPDAARAATPRALDLLVLLRAHGGSLTLRRLAEPAIAAAEQAGSAERVALLAAIGRHGALALRSDEAVRALVRAGGRAAGGLLGEHDLEAARPTDEPARARREQASELWEPAWPLEAEASAVEAIVAADERGTVAVLAYLPDRDGVLVPELGLRLARFAVPVRRGFPRVTPGTPLAMPLPLAVAHRRDDGWFAAVAVSGGALAELPRGAFSGEDETLLGLALRLLERAPGARGLIATTQRGRTTALRTPPR